MALELLKITGSQPYLLNNANTAEELVVALEDYMRTGTQIIFQHDGDDCILTSYEYNADENTVIAYFVTPKKKLLKVDIGAGWDLVITESEFTPETDTTLTQSGKPADAKAVGDAIANKASKTELNSYATKNELSSYATKTYVDNAVENSGGGIGEDVLAMLAQAGDALNKVSSKAMGVEVWFVIEKYPEAERINMAWEAMQQGMPVDIELVETLPQTPIISTEEAIYLYVVNSTGIAYLYDGTRILSLGDSFYGATNHGWTTDINAETAGGVYCVRTNNFATEEYVNKAIANNGGGGSGSGGGASGGGGIIDVMELPTTNIDENALYRTISATFYMDGDEQRTTIHIVNGLPSSGEPFTQDGQTVSALYYNKADGEAYFYVDNALSAMGLPVGWLNGYQLAQILDVIMAGGEGVITYGGVFKSKADVVGKPTIYLVAADPLYFYKNGTWREVATEGASLSLKTKLFTSWDEALAFCSKTEVYKIKVEGLKITGGQYGNYPSNSSAGTFISKFVLGDGKWFNMWLCSPHNAKFVFKLLYSVDYSEDGSYTVNFSSAFSHMEENFLETSTSPKKIISRDITDIDSSGVSIVIVQYFA